MNFDLFLKNLEKLLLKISIGEGEELQPKEEHAVLGYSGMITSWVMLTKLIHPLFFYLPFQTWHMHKYTSCAP